MKTFIYKLIDPNTNKIRYVGKSTNLKRRYRQHTNKKIQQKAKTHLSNWLLTLLNNSQKPILEEIENCEDSWKEREIFWIKYYRELGYKMCNKTDGGDGCSGYKWTEEKKKYRSKAFKGKNTWMKGRKFTEEHCKNMSKAKTGSKHPAAKKIRDISTGIVYFTLTKAALSLDIKRSTLAAMLTGQNPNKTNLKYYE